MLFLIIRNKLSHIRRNAVHLTRPFSSFSFQVGDDFVHHAESLCLKGEEVDAKELMTLYTMDAIFSAGFGVSTNCFKEGKEGIFYNMVRREMTCMGSKFAKDNVFRQSMTKST